MVKKLCENVLAELQKHEYVNSHNLLRFYCIFQPVFNNDDTRTYCT